MSLCMFIERYRRALVVFILWLIANALVFTFAWFRIEESCTGEIGGIGKFSVLGSFNNSCQSSESACCNLINGKNLNPNLQPCELRCENPCNLLGRVLGHNLNLNLALMLLPVARNSIWTTLFGLSFERAIFFHRWLGAAIFCLMSLHMIFWWVAYPMLSKGWFCWAISFHFYSDMFKGEIAFIFLCISALFALEYFRRNYFELFYYTHHLYILIYSFAFWHTWSVQDMDNYKNFSQDFFGFYLIFPATLYIIDRLIRFYRSRFFTNTLVSIEPEIGGITSLMIMRENFSFHPGQYCFICIPAISWLQWHPFSLSGAPSQKGELNFHIKSMGKGTWTGILNEFARKVVDDPENLTILVDGPYGNPSIDIQEFPVLVFISGGIGITPTISTLYNILDQPQNYPKLRQVHFHWIMKDSSSVAWFNDIWVRIFAENTIQVEDSDGYLNFDLSEPRGNISINVLFHVTGISGREATSEELISVKHIAKISTRIPKENFTRGRPKFPDIFAKIARDEALFGEVGVFASGPRSMIRDVQRNCYEHQWAVHNENFFL